MESIKVDDLLESPIFRCKVCRKRLSCPVMEVESLGNICGHCYKKKTYANAKENEEISSVLSKLRASCCYSKQGCVFQGSLSETTAHEDICKYKDKVCPFSFIDKCSKSPFLTITKHIRMEHKQYVHYYNSDMIKIEFPLHYAFEEFRLLIINDVHYLLRIKLDLTNNVLLFVAYYFEYNGVSHFIITHENEEFSTKSKDCIIVPDFYLTSTFDSNNATRFDLLSLKKCFKNTVTTIITIFTPIFEIANNKLLRCMECPVCNEHMSVQITQCSQGHSLCRMCRQKLHECPLCKSGFGASRNYALESLSFLINFPCKNIGCKKYISGDDIEKHELDCNFKHYPCPFLIKLDCKWKGLHGDVTEHLLAEHSDYTVFQNFIERKIVLDFVNYKYDTICIILGEHIFKVCVCVSGANKLFLTFGLYGPTNIANKFLWETGIYHKNSDKHKFVIKDVCSSYTTTNYKLNIEGYGLDDAIYFYHKVTYNNV